MLKMKWKKSWFFGKNQYLEISSITDKDKKKRYKP